MAKAVKGIKDLLGGIFKAGNAADEANDVRHPALYCTQRTNDSKLQAPLPQPANAMSAKSSHETTPPLPAYPWATDASPSPPARRTAASIGPKSPERPRPIYEDGLLPDEGLRLTQLPYDAKRRKPSDATRAPDPKNGYQGPSSKVKPGAGMGIQPINTLNGSGIADRINPRHGRNHTTYSRGDRQIHVARSIGREQHAGQQEFARRHPNYKPQSTLAQPSPAKRQKTEHPVPIHKPTEAVFEIDDSEDEVQHAAPTPRSGRSNVPSHSPHSVASRQSAAGAKPSSQPRSEFQETDETFRARRPPKPRRRTPNLVEDRSQAFQLNVPMLSAGQLSRGESVEVVERSGEIEEPTPPVALESIERGVNHKSNHRDHVQQHATAVTSRHFAQNKMRINESTTEIHERDANGGRGQPPATRNLRDFRAAGSDVVKVKGDLIEDSEDELAQPTSNMSKPRTQKLPQPVHGSTGVPRRRRVMGKTYQLDYLQTYDLESRGKPLMLEETEISNKFRVIGQDHDCEPKVLKILNLASVNKVVQDNTHNMRLTGPVTKGNMYWFDLHFVSFAEFLHFRNEYVFPGVADRAQHTVTQEKMRHLFQVPLKWNDKFDTTPMMDEQVSSPEQNNGGTSRTRLPTRKDMAIPRHQNPKQPLAPQVVSARATRATRATAPIRAQSMDAEKVVKYSVNPGLGKRWDKQLEFSLDLEEGFLKRRKSTVDFNDLCRLDEGEMLNDALINFDLLYMYDDLKVSKEKVFFFGTQFFEALTTNTKGRDAINYDAVKNWTRRDDIFSYNYLVVPIHEGAHWYLAIIYNVSSIERKPAIEGLDSDLQDSLYTATDAPKVQSTEEEKHDTIAQFEDEAASGIPAMGGPLDDRNVDEDVNLFEEEKEERLSLIDRDKEGLARGNLATTADENIPVSDTGTTELLSTPNGEAASHPLHVQAPKRKTKRKPTAPRKDPKKPGIMILDSLALSHPKATRALREWLQAEGLQKRGITVEIDNKCYYAKETQVPTQNNVFDCGLYVLGYTRQFFRNPDQFVSKLLTGDMSADTDWPNMQPPKMRHKIRDVLFQLYKEQKVSLKAKKATKTKGSPTIEAKAGVQDPSSNLQGPGNIKSDSSAAVPPTAARLSPEKGQVEPAPEAAAKPRLASPFEPRVQSGDVPSETTENTVEGGAADSKLATLEERQDASPRCSKNTQVQQRSSPEVRIVARSPHIATTAHAHHVGESDRSTTVARRSTDALSPPKRQKLRSQIEGILQKPSAKKVSASSPARPTREKAVRSSPLQSRTRSGSHDDPIALDDSQDLDVMTQKPPKSTKKPSPEIIELDRSQEAVSVPVRRARGPSNSSPTQRRPRQRTYQHNDSLYEVSEQEWQEENDLARALGASLEHTHGRHKQSSRHSSPMLDREMKDVDDSQMLDSVSSHTARESQGIDVEHYVVRETPEPQRSSPGVGGDAMDWQAGTALP